MNLNCVLQLESEIASLFPSLSGLLEEMIEAEEMEAFLPSI